jgi:hypothetical protein
MEVDDQSIVSKPNTALGVLYQQNHHPWYIDHCINYCFK